MIQALGLRRPEIVRNRSVCLFLCDPNHLNVSQNSGPAVRPYICTVRSFLLSQPQKRDYYSKCMQHTVFLTVPQTVTNSEGGGGQFSSLF